jgi:ectoine hydroxylase-related dioxygenase (phytanoyl-CoA dioxygenase family)
VSEHEAREIASDLERIGSRGYVVLPELVPVHDLEAVRDQLAPHLTERQWGRNDFEGRRTERVYALLAKAPRVAALVEHPKVLAVVDALLEPNYLLSANLAIKVHPGQQAQRLHFDDGCCSLARPRPHTGRSVIWAIDEFTLENGATQVIPESHTFGPGAPSEDDARIETVVMSPGSALVFLGTLWHRGGQNRSATTRLAVTPQYCQPWVRQIENMSLAVPAGKARQYSARVQELLGYSIHPPFIGYVDGMHPRRLLDRGHVR